MRVLMAASEIDPFAKTGGLADVASSLPKALKKEGIDISLVMPFYKKFVLKSGLSFQKTDLEFEIILNGKKYSGLFYISFLNDVPVYLMENDEFFDRENLYGTPTGDYPDNGLRFGFFCYGILELAKLLGDIKIIHLNDWQTALVPLIKMRKYPHLAQIKTLLSIHNLAYQGIFEKEILEKLNLGYEDFHMEGVEFYGKVNFLKAGIVYSDYINTVSPTYAEEIQTAEFGYGLDGILRRRKDVLFGILNGIDYEVWDPQKDNELYFNYSKDNIIEGKKMNKERILKDCGLEGLEKPLFGIVSRLAEQKGFDLFPSIIETIARENLNLIVLGAGDKIYQDMFTDISKRYANVYVKIGFDPVLAKRIYASSDFFLMPSKYEPCGLGQLISMRYGTIPVVRATGGLKDTVKDIEKGGYGIVFEKYEPRDLLRAIERAIGFYRNTELFEKSVKYVFSLDFSWKSSAKEYLNLYKRMLS
ncbi:MAG: glycogen/starch synthase [candidate division WOR-3 bacterium]